MKTSFQKTARSQLSCHGSQKFSKSFLPHTACSRARKTNAAYRVGRRRPSARREQLQTDGVRRWNFFTSLSSEREKINSGKRIREGLVPLTSPRHKDFSVKLRGTERTSKDLREATFEIKEIAPF
eukprot:Gb_16222 [translate_table: standard]